MKDINKENVEHICIKFRLSHLLQSTLSAYNKIRVCSLYSSFQLPENTCCSRMFKKEYNKP